MSGRLALIGKKLINIFALKLRFRLETHQAGLRCDEGYDCSSSRLVADCKETGVCVGGDIAIAIASRSRLAANVVSSTRRGSQSLEREIAEAKSRKQGDFDSTADESRL